MNRLIGFRFQLALLAVLTLLGTGCGSDPERSPHLSEQIASRLPDRPVRGGVVWGRKRSHAGTQSGHQRR
ncbi:hypothetical protein, partial [Corallococcus sp. AB030]|uniref:hypothetical protein n=1 Tax=Corallococcus sp. AB030 TaxID=2316716 RepID=UPI001F238ECD